MDKRILITPAKRTGQARLVHPKLAYALVKQGVYKIVDDTEPVSLVEVEVKPKRTRKPAAKAAEPEPEVEVVFTPDEPEVVETPEAPDEDDETETPKPTPKRRTYRRRDLKAEE